MEWNECVTLSVCLTFMNNHDLHFSMKCWDWNVF